LEILEDEPDLFDEKPEISDKNGVLILGENKTKKKGIY